MILLTSLVWFLVDVVVLMFYSDCINGSGWNCQEKRANTEDNPFADKLRGSLDDSLDTEVDPKRRYKQSELQLWRPPAMLKEQKGSPGEMGNAVHIPDSQQARQQELFKLNQFNLMASDMISLNR